MDLTVKYVHKNEVHNINASGEVVPILVDLFNPQSVLDVGCGIGTWLKSFTNAGVSKILGLDGDYVNRDLLNNYISLEQFQATDLNNPFNLEQKFDLVISLEVAEHLPESSAQYFVESLCKHGDLIVFSAALPGQGGQNHLNEQYKSYWIQKFDLLGYRAFDLLRPRIWDNIKVDWWYKQNIIVFSNKDLSHLKVKEYPFFDVIHPGLLSQNLEYITYLKQYINELETKLYSGKE